jgi:hypothetical protein
MALTQMKSTLALKGIVSADFKMEPLPQIGRFNELAPASATTPKTLDLPPRISRVSRGLTSTYVIVRDRLCVYGRIICPECSARKQSDKHSLGTASQAKHITTLQDVLAT